MSDGENLLTLNTPTCFNESFGHIPDPGILGVLVLTLDYILLHLTIIKRVEKLKLLLTLR